jgi:hypothetical protein
VRAYAVVRPGEKAEGTHLVDADGHIRRGYGIEDGCVLVRPDGYIGFIAADGAAVLQYLRGVVGGTRN